MPFRLAARRLRATWRLRQFHYFVNAAGSRFLDVRRSREGFLEMEMKGEGVENVYRGKM